MASLMALVLALAAPGPPPEGEARISLDIKDAPVEDIVRLLTEVGGFQAVFDPGISCKLTVKLTEVRWQAALDVSLRSCRLGREEENGILRIAPVDRLGEESAARRRLEEEQRLSAPHTVARFRLSYARAQEIAPLLKRFLSVRGDVVYDARTNTLIIVD
jgi:type IV pilus assembly protein PilQ